MKRNTVVVMLAVLLVLPGCSLLKKKPQATPSPAPRTGITEPVNVIAVSDRPFLSITPNNIGRELTLAVNGINKPANEAEYELEYQSGELLQGAFGSFLFNSDDYPQAKEILLGSCSAGGKCSYHENVTGGTLTMKFSGEEVYAIKTEWRLMDTKSASGKFASRDSKFQIDAGKNLDKSGFVVVMNTSGMPKNPEAELLAGPYGLYPSGGLPKSGKLKVTMHLSQTVDSAKIKGWDGSKWVDFKATVTEKTAMAEVDPLEVFIATK